jgi:hypothetical protein
MVKKLSLVCVILLSITLLVTGCGIPQEDYDAVVAERDAAEAKVERMKTDLETAKSDLSIVEGELDTLKRQVTALHSELAQAQIAQAVVEEFFGKLLFFDSFEDGDTQGWEFWNTQGLTLKESWPVIQEDSRYVMQSIEQQWANAGTSNWDDYTLQARVNFIEEGVHINFRICNEGRYFFGFYKDFLILHKEIEHEVTTLQQSWQPHNLNQWHDLRVEVEGSNIRVYVDGVLEIDYTDSEPLLNGNIAFESGAGRVQVDNILLTTGK